jgi:hypothetical protein
MIPLLLWYKRMPHNAARQEFPEKLYGKYASNGPSLSDYCM